MPGTCKITTLDVAPFKLGTLQQALQVRDMLYRKGFTFLDLEEYVAQFTGAQDPVIGYTEPAERKKELPQTIALTREERKKFRRGIRR